MHTDVAVFICAAALAAALTFVLGRLAVSRHWLDRDEGRGQIAYRPVPRVGGIAVVLAFIAAQLLSAAMGQPLFGTFAPTSWCAALAIFAVGCRDDFRPVSPRVKLLVLLLGGALLAAGGNGIRRIPGIEHALGPVASMLLTSLWVGAIATAWNFVDGLDGIAAGCAALAGLGLWIGGSTDGSAAALTGAAVGFLVHNRYPARIFLGDGGSFFLGFWIAAFAIRPGTESSGLLRSLSVALVVGWPLLDLVWAMVLRIRERSLFRASGHHVHYWLSSRVGHRSAALFVIAGAGASTTAFVFLHAPLSATLTMAGAVGALWLFCTRIRVAHPALVAVGAITLWLVPGKLQSSPKVDSRPRTSLGVRAQMGPIASLEGMAEHLVPSPMGETLP
jgi:UDP-GlcNAc:undecaprenyl-phosphate/decaprenyl-phosphate GlcNAc-1-phosphate transferase